MNPYSRGTIAIIGQGYVGLPLAMAAFRSGWKVFGIDSSPKRIDQLKSGISPIEDISSLELQSAINSGRFVPTGSFTEISNSQIIIFCVPTPLDKNQKPDLSALLEAAEMSAPHVQEGCLVISESTSFPGTLREFIIPIFSKHFSGEISQLFFASAPERVNPGDKIWKQENTPRLVSGIDSQSHSLALEFYESICQKVISVSTPEIAEAAKLLENTFRLVNIGLINEFAQICAENEINVSEVITAAATKPYGFTPFYPGVGVGGHCIPVDPLYLTWWARRSGVVPFLIESAISVNNEMPIYVGQRAFDLIRKILKSPRVLILGVAYKSGVADVRETPVSKLREYLLNKGAIVKWHDQLVQVWHGEISSNLEEECDIVIVATRQPGVEIKSFIEKGIPVLDCTNSFTNLEGVTSL